ncbi:MAG TPA: FUSC family protein [Candidatus Limnocylindrales bacterium]|nr:FUSC family protein [Candidatus Limnocylindrales bacterium]
MAHSHNWLASRLTRDWLIHSVRSAVAAAVSLLIARAFRLPESYWAPLTTIVVMQSTLGAAWTPSVQRFLGTALGAAFGDVVATYLPSNVLVFTVGIFVLGLICALLGLDRSAYRFSGITLAIVLLVAHNRTPWIVALHRFFEVSVGIIVGLAISALWPQKPSAAPVAAPAAVPPAAPQN